MSKRTIKIYKEAKLCYICGKTTPETFSKDSNYRKVRYHYHFTDNYRGAAHNICKLNFNMPDTILVVFHRVSSYDYHFIIKVLANEFQTEFECCRENKEKYKNSSCQ